MKNKIILIFILLSIGISKETNDCDHQYFETKLNNIGVLFPKIEQEEL